MMKKLLILLSGLLMVIALSGIASAATIFSDDFNRNSSNTVGNGWGEIENDGDDVAIIYNQYLLLRDNNNSLPDAAVYRTISTSGYTNISFSLDWYADNETENNDYLYVSWDTGDNDNINLWADKIVFTDSLNSENYWHSISYNFNTEVNNKSNFRIAIWTNVSNSDEYAKIDNFKLMGTVSNPVPEPATMMLFGLGLLGLAGVSRKKK